MRLFWDWVLRDVEGGGGAGGAGGGAAGGVDPKGASGAGAGGAGAGGEGGLAKAAADIKAGQGAGEGAADAWFPEGLDAKLKGKDASETLVNVAKRFGEMPKPPADAAGYTFTPGDGIKQFFDGDGDQKVLGVAREIALKHGLSQGQFEGFVNGFYGEAIKGGLLSLPADPKGEIEILGGKDGTPADRLQRGVERVQALGDTIKGFATAGYISGQEATELTGEFVSARAIVAMEKLIAGFAKKDGGPGNGGKPGGDGLTDHERSIARMYPTMVIK